MSVNVVMCVCTHVSVSTLLLSIECDTRKPNIMRVAPTPLYTFIDVLMFFKQLEQILQPTTYIAIIFYK